VVDAAFAVLTVTAALLRYTMEVVARSPRSALHRLPLVSPRPAPDGLLAAAARLAAHPGTEIRHTVGNVLDVLVPATARTLLSRLDVPALVRQFVDLDTIVDRVDLDRAVDRVDIARILDRIDLDDIVARVNLDRAVDRVDIARILDRIDLDDIVARVDLDRAVDRVDIARILDRIDLDEIVARVNLDRAVDRVDLDRVIDRADVIGLVRYVIREIDLPALLRSSTGSVTSEMVRSVRDQGADADRAVERVVDRFLLRRRSRRGAEGADDDDR
jgi:hypothetical protein